MRLAATLTPRRGALRRAIRVAGTLRGRDEEAVDIAILDISTTGFLAELPEGTTLEPGAQVRVATSAIGRQQAVVVRHEGRRHGFAFAQSLAPATVATIDPQATNVEPLFAAARVDPARSPRASLTLAVVAGSAVWTVLALLLYLTA